MISQPSELEKKLNRLKIGVLYPPSMVSYGLPWNSIFGWWSLSEFYGSPMESDRVLWSSMNSDQELHWSLSMLHTMLCLQSSWFCSNVALCNSSLIPCFWSSDHSIHSIRFCDSICPLYQMELCHIIASLCHIPCCACNPLGFVQMLLCAIPVQFHVFGLQTIPFILLDSMILFIHYSQLLLQYSIAVEFHLPECSGRVFKKL